MADPEMVFEIVNGLWFPVSYQQDNLGLYQEAAGEAATRDQCAFALQWDRNLREQGFLTAAKQLAAG